MNRLLLPQTPHSVEEAHTEKDERRTQSQLTAQEVACRKARNFELAQEIWRSAQARKEAKARRFQAELRQHEARKVAKLQALKELQEQIIAKRSKQLQDARSELSATELRQHEAKKVATLQALKEQQQQSVAKRSKQLQDARSELSATELRIQKTAADDAADMSESVFQNFLNRFLPFTPFA